MKSAGSQQKAAKAMPIVKLPDGYQAPSFNSDGTRVYYMDAAPPPPDLRGSGKARPASTLHPPRWHRQKITHEIPGLLRPRYPIAR